MAGMLSGLSGLGLGNLENMNIFGEEKEPEKSSGKTAAVTAAKVAEKDLIYDKNMECPVCARTFSTKIVKSGKAKLLGTDQDLRARYEGIDPVKYDVYLCPTCGYAALSRYYSTLSSAQAKLIKQEISRSVRVNSPKGETYSYEEALERYQLALANAVVKRAKNSEKAYICLKTAWLLRGWQEQLGNEENADKSKLAELAAAEEEYLQNSLQGFTEAVRTESFPMCGMDEMTVDYLLAVLAKHFRKYDVASKMVATILTSASANSRIKDKARDLKDEILAELKKPRG